jgi:hypothetical protein
MGRNILDSAVAMIRAPVVKRRIKRQIPKGWKKYTPPAPAPALFKKDEPCYFSMTKDGTFEATCSHHDIFDEQGFPFSKCPDYPCELIEKIQHNVNRKIGRMKPRKRSKNRKI